MLIPPPTTGDSRLDAFLSAVYEHSRTLEAKSIPEDGWSLSDFTAQVSEVIGDKRDLIDIVTQYDDIETYANAIEEQKVFLNELAEELRNIDTHAGWFAEIMEWWDQNYQIIEDAAELMRNVRAAEKHAADAGESASQAAESEGKAKTSESNAATSETNAEEHRRAAEEALSAITPLKDSAVSEISTLAADRVTEIEQVTLSSIETIDDHVAIQMADFAEESERLKEQLIADGTHAVTAAGAEETLRAKNEADRARDEADRAKTTALDTTNARLEDVLGGAPEDLDTFREVATAIQELDSETDGIISTLANKPDKSYVDEGLSGKASLEHTHSSREISDPTSSIGDSSKHGERVVKTLSTGWIDLPSDPLADNHPARKGYVDAEVSKKADTGHTHTSSDITGTRPVIGRSQHSDSIVRTSADGWFYVESDPTSGTHPARKSYVDQEVAKKADAEHTHTSADITDTTFKIGSQWESGKVLTASPSGEIYRYGTAEPDNTAALVNKFYVDREVAKKADEGHKHTSSDVTDKTHYGGTGNAGKVANWGSDGHLYDPNDPTNSNQLANKAYVDKKVAPMSGAGASIIPHVDGVQSWGVPVRSDFSTEGHGRYYSHNTGGTTTGANTFFKVDPSIPYYFSFWARATKAGSRIYIECRDQSGDHAVESGAVPGGGRYLVGDLELPTEWTKFETVIRFKEGVSEARVAGVYWNHSNGSVRDATQYVTDLHLVPIAPHTHTSADITDSTRYVGRSGDANSVVTTDFNGWFNIPMNPVKDNHPARKSYVDGEVNKKADKDHTHPPSDITGSKTWIGRAGDSNGIVKTTSLGWIHIGSDPTVSTHPARKGYVDRRPALFSGNGAPGTVPYSVPGDMYLDLNTMEIYRLD